MPLAFLEVNEERVMLARDLLAIVFSPREDEPVVLALEALSGENGRSTALLAELLPYPVIDERAATADLWSVLMERAQERFSHEREILNERCEKALTAIAVGSVQGSPASIGPEIALAARHADFTMMLRPHGSAHPDDPRAVFEEVLLGSGRPVLLIPPNWKKRAIGRNIVVGWNAKREAARLGRCRAADC